MRERIELAAYCGHKGARLVAGNRFAWPESAIILRISAPRGFLGMDIGVGLGGTPFSDMDNWNLEKWTARLPRWGKQTMIRAAIAAAKAVSDAVRTTLGPKPN